MTPTPLLTTDATLEVGRGSGAPDGAGSREWLVTNGIGGYASGTVAGHLTRRYHGLLVAALAPPLGRTLLVAKLSETADYDGRTWPLATDRWVSGALEPRGFLQLERFHLEGAVPVWTYAVADALLEKRLWMTRGENTTYISYHLRRAGAPLTLSVKALVNYRDHHAVTRAGAWRMAVEGVVGGIRVTAFEGAVPFFLLSGDAESTASHSWYHDFLLTVERYRGLEDREDHLYAGRFEARLEPGQTLTVVASTEASPELDGLAAYRRQLRYQQSVVARSSLAAEPRWIRQLLLAADQFLVRRRVAGSDSKDMFSGRTVIAGYPWFGDWGRDTMIALPGLTLATGRAEEAEDILRTFARFFDRGMLPNRFPEVGEEPEYNTVDATWWYFEALRAHLEATADRELLAAIFPLLEDSIDWHEAGTRYGIEVDAGDGLLRAGEPGVQLTWMDAKVGDLVVTPRIGKPVEVNALWYNALCCMVRFAAMLGVADARYRRLADSARMGFQRFWRGDRGYLFDVLDGPGGHDGSLRPNQLLAVSLPHSPLSAFQRKGVVDICAKKLLTSYGLRSLAAEHPDYRGHYGGDQRRRDTAYHQGTVWSWLIGPFATAHYRVYRDAELARSFLIPFRQHLRWHGLGSISEIFDGDAPFHPRGTIAQAWGVAEVLRAWRFLRAADSPTDDPTPRQPGGST